VQAIHHAKGTIMKIEGAVVFVTGANRGLGLEFAKQALARGARKVYAAARDPATVTLPGVVPVKLDVTDPAAVAAAADAARDVTLLINNAGISTGASVLTGDLADVRRELDTHLFGTLDVTRSFVPVIEGNGGGAILNVLSVLSWIAFPRVGAYSTAKAAEWAMTNALRVELAPRNVHVAGLHVGYMDTDLAAGVDGPKADPAVVAKLALDELAAGSYEIVADEVSRNVQAGLAGGVPALYPALA
jgi:NAD(P)-dependent dehydrogenase (short-subunit alcohol dehydrogenase family)